MKISLEKNTLGRRFQFNLKFHKKKAEVLYKKLNSYSEKAENDPEIETTAIDFQ